MTITADALDARLVGLSERLDQATGQLRQAIANEGEAERLYSLAKSNAWLATTGTIRDREAQVDKVIAVERERAHTATAMTKAGFEEIRNIRQMVSSLQTIAAAQRSADYAHSQWNQQREGSRNGN